MDVEWFPFWIWIPSSMASCSTSMVVLDCRMCRSESLAIAAIKGFRSKWPWSIRNHLWLVLQHTPTPYLFPKHFWWYTVYTLIHIDPETVETIREFAIKNPFDSFYSSCWTCFIIHSWAASHSNSCAFARRVSWNISAPLPNSKRRTLKLRSWSQLPLGKVVPCQLRNLGEPARSTR